MEGLVGAGSKVEDVKLGCVCDRTRSDVMGWVLRSGVMGWVLRQ